MSSVNKSNKLVPSAGRRTPSLPPEIWRIVAEQIAGRKTLRALVQVCRLFRDVFRPFLHVKYTIDLSRHEPIVLAQKTLPTCLAYTKEFEVNITEFRQSELHRGVYYNIDLNDGYAAFVVRALKAMPNLRSIRWVNISCGEDYNLSLIFSSEEVLAAAKSCPKLQDVFIQLPDVFLVDSEDAMLCNTPVKGFRNLASLELLQLYGEDSELINNIANVMKACPGLKKLGLGLSCEFDYEWVPEILAASGDCDFLEKLCLKYGTRSSPLALETLRLGHGLFVYSSKSPNVGNYLAKLVKLRDLKTLHIYNGFVHETDDWNLPATPMKVQWDFFSECTLLRQLAASTLDRTLRQWLNSHGKSTQELLIMEHYNMYDGSLSNFDNLKLPQLSMLFTREMTIDAHVYDLGWRDTNSESSRPPYFRKNQITALDRLSARAANLTRLGICIELENQWARFSSNLSKLQRLIYLRMDSKSHRSGPYPASSTSLWPGVVKPKEIAKRYIQLMRSKCPSLQYVQVKNWAWQITSPLPGVPVREVAAEKKVELREMEWEERMSIELFALDSFAQESGLPGPDHYHEELSEQEEQQMQLIMAEVERRAAAGDLDLSDLF
ncbi:hypothetical protein N431DRAFT_415599 [Stipitochalara longipes BDJ]|nr:hypothetical protein N431DRAFT_415599 [Stipitochalara longipes BDJ]